MKKYNIREHLYHNIIVWTVYSFVSFTALFIWYNVIEDQEIIKSSINAFTLWLSITFMVLKAICIIAVSSFILSIIIKFIRYFMIVKPIEKERIIMKARAEELEKEFIKDIQNRERERHENGKNDPRTFSINN